MKNILMPVLCFLSFHVTAQKLMIDFGKEGSKSSDWVLLSDNIMGGVTKSSLQYTSNSALLTGTISLDNFGGFSSLKTKYKKMDLSGFEGVKIRFKSKGQKFAFTLEDSQIWFQPNFKKDFAPKKEETWEDAVLYFKDFKEYMVGEPTGKGFRIESLKNMVRLGIMTTEKKEGPFSLEVDYIEFF